MFNYNYLNITKQRGDKKMKSKKNITVEIYIGAALLNFVLVLLAKFLPLSLEEVYVFNVILLIEIGFLVVSLYVVKELYWKDEWKFTTLSNKIFWWVGFVFNLCLGVFMFFNKLI